MANEDQAVVNVVYNDKTGAVVPITSEFDLFWRRTLLKKKKMDAGISSDEAEKQVIVEIPA